MQQIPITNLKFGGILPPASDIVFFAKLQRDDSRTIKSGGGVGVKVTCMYRRRERGTIG